jgi:hypothetical protein
MLPRLLIISYLAAFVRGQKFYQASVVLYDAVEDANVDISNYDLIARQARSAGSQVIVLHL